MTTHDLKCWTEYFNPVWNGVKLFEIRKNDRNYKVGDYLRLKDYNPTTEKYMGRELLCKVTYLLDNKAFLAEGYVAMSLQVVERTTPSMDERLEEMVFI